MIENHLANCDNLQIEFYQKTELQMELKILAERNGTDNIKNRIGDLNKSMIATIIWCIQLNLNDLKYKNLTTQH